MYIVSMLIAVSFFVCLSFFEIERFGVDFLETIPINFCLVNLVLYILAFINKLYWIDYIELLTLVLIGTWLCRNKDKNCITREQGRQILFVVILFVIILVGMRNRSIGGWDDFKFWAPQVKSLYYINGVEARNTNVVPAFGDYPMGMQLIEWWFEHCSKSFNEEALYIGQMIYTVSFILPVFKKAVTRMETFPILLGVIIAFGSIFTRLGVGLDPDRTMAFAYAGALISAINIQQNETVFFRLQFALITSSLCLMKSIGIFWACSAIVFYIVVSLSHKKRFMKWGVVFAISVFAVYFSWCCFCLLYERTTDITQVMYSSMKMSIGEQFKHISEHPHLIKYYLQVLFAKPMNCSDFNPELRWFGVGLSPIALIIVAFFIYFLSGRKDHSIRCIWLYNTVICIGYAVILLWSYYFMFLYGQKDITLKHLQNTTSHYYEPAVCGMFVCAVYLLLIKTQEKSERKKNVCLLIVLLLFANIPMTYALSFSGSSDYYQVKQEERKKTEAQVITIEENIRTAALSSRESRLLICVSQESELNYLSFCMLHYKLAPLSTMEYKGQIDEDTLKKYADQYHCNYVYFDESCNVDNVKDLFDDFDFSRVIHMNF